ncbi:MAG TPA: ZIP family metal transporter [Verrucomicrobiae bacterium]|jgi:zinc and cadmium transporter
MKPDVLLAIYCALVLVASLAGGWFLLLIHLTHTRLQIAVSFVAGLMLGIALLHFLPDADDNLHNVDKTAEWLVGGFLVMFFVQRFFHFHHHDLPEGDPEDCCGHDHGHVQDNIRANFRAHEEHAHTLADKSAKHLSWVGTTLGLTLHSLLDGLALAVAVQSGAHGNAKFAGLGVALVVILHKPFDAMAVSTLTAAGGKSRSFRHVLNGLFAFASPIGAVLFYFGMGFLTHGSVPVLGCSLAFCAGSFLCISSADLLPELQFHSHDRFKLSIALLAGLAVAIIIKYFEAS